LRNVLRAVRAAIRQFALGTDRRRPRTVALAAAPASAHAAAAPHAAAAAPALCAKRYLLCGLIHGKTPRVNDE
jgi:hypothetical protein